MTDPVFRVDVTPHHPLASTVLGRLRAGELRPRYHHGVGFAQCYLSDDVRLHVWSPALPGAPEAFGCRHDHRFDLESHVLLGGVVDTRYQLMTSSSMGDWRVYEVRPAHEGRPDEPVAQPDYYHALTLPPRVVPAGGSYTLSRRVFHMSQPVGPTVTVMRKRRQSAEWARILAPYGQSPEHGMARPPPGDLDDVFQSTLCGLPHDAWDAVAAVLADRGDAHD